MSPSLVSILDTDVSLDPKARLSPFLLNLLLQLRITLLCLLYFFNPAFYT
jgi:hypothetical protein